MRPQGRPHGDEAQSVRGARGADGPSIDPRRTLSRDYVHNSVEVTGASTGAVDNGVRAAVASASQALHHLGWLEVAAIRGLLDWGRVERFQVPVKLRYAGRP
jgi:dodecin